MPARSGATNFIALFVVGINALALKQVITGSCGYAGFPGQILGRQQGSGHQTAINVRQLKIVGVAGEMRVFPGFITRIRHVFRQPLALMVTAVSDFRIRLMADYSAFGAVSHIVFRLRMAYQV